tara:strand:- start:376 stop:888 length:513 start_codon:yes stop_codon:yes gene_type:complete
MKSKGNIVFLGMMGSGKSSIGKLVSKELNLNFYDVDILIEKKLNMKIPKIFQLKGEKFFRDFEEKLTMDTLRKKNTVVSLGGGAFLNNTIRKEILSNHISFWLSLSGMLIADRIKKSTKRPVALNLTKQELVKLNNKRSGIYSKALYKINCDNLTKTEIVKKILNIYETN